MVVGVGGEGAAPDEEVAEVGVRVAAGAERLGAEVVVEEVDGFVVGDSEAVVGVGVESGDHGWAREIGVEGSHPSFARVGHPICDVRRGRAAAAGVDGLVVRSGKVFVGGLGHLGEFAAAAGAGVDVACGEEAVEGGAVGGEALGLGEDGRGPCDAEPGEVLEHGFDEFGAGALGVEVFVAEQQGAVVLAGSGEGREEGRGVAEVEKAGWGWGQAADVGHREMIEGRPS